jgi:hypothetical protein
MSLSTLQIMQRLLVAIAMLGLGACDKDGDPEQQYVTKELAELKAALAARDESKVLVGCISLSSSRPRMPKSITDQIDQHCSVDAPKLLLENAVKDATEAKAKHSELAELNCMQILAADAFEMISAYPPKDPALQKLVDEYTRLCPEQVAKFRARP